MITIGEVLRDWRATHPDLQNLGPGGTRLNVRLATDRDAKSAPYPRSVLELRMTGSEMDAVVPFRLTETLTVANGYEEQLGSVANAVVSALNGKCHFNDRGAIHSHRLTGWSAGLDTGAVQTVQLEWEGEASW